MHSLAKTNVGCLEYLAPERLRTPEAPYSCASDVWAFGLALMEIALGKYPFSGKEYDSLFSRLHAVMNGHFPHLPETLSNDGKDFIKGW